MSLWGPTKETVKKTIQTIVFCAAAMVYHEVGMKKRAWEHFE
jgi:hypothetical protein